MPQEIARWKIATGAIGVIVLIVVAVLLLGSLYTPNSGDITVVRNGKSILPSDWFDNHKIRGIVQNGAGNSFIGLGSSTHPYPTSTQQRFYRMCNQCANADTGAVTVPTSDGVEVTISGTFYFYTAFGDPTLDRPEAKCQAAQGGGVGDCLLKAFDTQFGTRTFAGRHVFGGQQGFQAWLGVIVEPISQNNLRSSISGVSCAQLVSSCALVQNNSQQQVTLAKGKANQSNINRIQDEVAQNLQNDLASNLGHNYFRDIKFQISGVSLPAQIQKAINDAQSAFAQISQAQAKIKSAQADAAANEEREKGYEQCPACATIDALKAIPKSVTTFAPGSGFSITPGGK